ncbi:MAG: hypothetical protein GQ574_16120 [Crocinitomix sp.]|nr:hypothetical protein [Crocinitomix sp.]
MYQISSIIPFIIFLFFHTSCTHSAYSQNSNSETLEMAIQDNGKLRDSLNLTYSTLSDSKRIEKIISDSRELGYFYPDEMIHLIDKTLKEVRETRNKRAEIELLFQRNYIMIDAYSDLEGSSKLSYYMLNNLPVTLEEQTQLLDLIARTHLAKSELVKAQILYQEALIRLKKIEKPYTKAHINVYWGIAVTYSESQNYEKSSDYYRKCLDQALYLGKYYMVTSCYHNLASNAGKMDQMRISKEYLDSAYNTSDKISNKSDRVISEMGLLNAYGDFYKSDSKLDSALICFRKSIQLSDKYNDFYTKSYATQALGSVYLELDRLDEAEAYLLNSYEMFSNKTPSLLLENSFNLYRLYKKKGTFEESLKWHEDYTAIRNSIQKAENIQIIAQATTKYEVELKDKTITLLKKEKILEAQAKEKYKRQWQIIIVLFLLLLVLGAFYVNHNRHQKSKKKIINQVLGEERERTRISMDLHDGVCAQITTISRIVKSNHQIHDAAWLTKVADKLDHLNLEVRDISHNLSLIKYDQRTPFQHIVEDYIGDIQETVPIRFVVKFMPKNEHIFLASNRELVLFRVIQEICSNAIKYSQTETMNLNFVRKGNSLFITITDHGIGFDKAAAGNGISNVFERIKFLKGKVELDTKNNGTTFNIQIPLNQNELNQK